MIVPFSISRSDSSRTSLLKCRTQLVLLHAKLLVCGKRGGGQFDVGTADAALHGGIAPVRQNCATQ